MILHINYKKFVLSTRLKHLRFNIVIFLSFVEIIAFFLVKKFFMKFEFDLFTLGIKLFELLPTTTLFVS